MKNQRNMKHHIRGRKGKTVIKSHCGEPQCAEPYVDPVTYSQNITDLCKHLILNAEQQQVYYKQFK